MIIVLTSQGSCSDGSARALTHDKCRHQYPLTLPSFQPLLPPGASLLSSTCPAPCPLCLTPPSSLPDPFLTFREASKKRRHRPGVHKAMAKVRWRWGMQPCERVGFQAAKGLISHQGFLGPGGRAILGVIQVIHDAHSLPAAEGPEQRTRGSSWTTTEAGFPFG